jgi:hypothetical protein
VDTGGEARVTDKPGRFAAAVEILAPHMKEMEAEFEREQRRFAELFSRASDIPGRILKSHLVLEHYLDRHLTEAMGLQHVDDARLSFYQKATLLPTERSVAGFIKPGILRVNTIRNRVAHNLDASIGPDDLEPMEPLLLISRPSVEGAEPIVKIEKFTILACTWLIPQKPEIKALWERAMATVPPPDLDPHDT